MLTEVDEKEIATLITAYFAGRVPLATAKLWAAELRSFSRADAMEAVRNHARAAQHPSLVDIIEAARALIRNRTPLAAYALPSRAGPSDEAYDAAAQKRIRAMMSTMGDQLSGLISSDEYEAEAERRKNMSIEDIEARRADLRAKKKAFAEEQTLKQAEDRRREPEAQADAMRDAFTEEESK